MSQQQHKDLPYITYGAKVSAEGVSALIEHAMDQMRLQSERPTPICIWGTHGIGKTELVRDIAERKGFAFTYFAPAQLEEMGDLIGMPRIKDELTEFAPPAWAPRNEGPGILLIDDVNRADDRILRGIMQLLQYYELISWSLPPQWLIVLTANPDGGDYSVTPMDDALLNRMLHVTMNFDAKIWARWAERAGVDARGVHFVLTYPEMAEGRRTTPRSLVQFFNAIHPIDDLRERLDLVKMLGDACLDEATTQAFIQFVHLKLDHLPSPADILHASDFEAVAQRLYNIVHEGDAKRLDVLSVVTARLANHLASGKTDAIDEMAMANLRRFILLEWLPNDLRLAMAQELTRSKRPELLRLYADPDIGKLLLNKM